MSGRYKKSSMVPGDAIAKQPTQPKKRVSGWPMGGNEKTVFEASKIVRWLLGKSLRP